MSLITKFKSLITKGLSVLGDATVTGNLTVDTNTLFVDATNNSVGIGTTTPSAKLHAISTTEQLRLGYDASNYLSATVGIAGLVTLTATGASAGVVLASPVTATAQPALSALSDTSVITKSLLDERFINPNTVLLREEFMGGGSTNNYGELGWYSYAAGGGTGAIIDAGEAASNTFPNIGQKGLVCGNATNAAQTLYLGSIVYSSFLTNTGWEVCYVFKLSQTTDCNVIVGFTHDGAAIGIGKYGSKSFGLRYSSSVDTNFTYFSKNTDLNWAANDANNYSLSSGVAVDTNWHTFRIRSTTSGVIEMSIDGGAWSTITNVLTSVTRLFPVFYISTLTTSTKKMIADFWSLRMSGASR